ncbi:MAG: hypothetical protein NTV51_01585 [Verrucomicrobia bacterium]|nr:hypothetical protein [Verrucomicrobiota bacterium]
MKISSLAFLTFCCLSTAMAGAASDQPRFGAVPAQSQFKADARAKAEFEEHGGERHKWKKGQALPESWAEAGLLPDATLVWSGLYLDGGTKGYLFRDSAGNFLALCTGPGLETKDHPKRIDAAMGSRLFLGGLHYAKESVAMVPPGGKAEAWLRKVLGEIK